MDTFWALTQINIKIANNKSNSIEKACEKTGYFFGVVPSRKKNTQLYAPIFHKNKSNKMSSCFSFACLNSEKNYHAGR